MPVNFTAPPAVDYIRFLPEILLTGFAIILMVLEPLTGARAKRYMGRIALVGLSGALAGAAWAGLLGGEAFAGMIVVDGFASFFRVLCIAAGILVALASINFMRREAYESGEYYALLLFSITGQSIMVSANNLIVVFIGLEISSIASYVLAGFLRGVKLANEAATKYFLLGSFATAFLLYGIALIYGNTGTLYLEGIRDALAASRPGLLAGTAASLMFVGFAFKFSAAPFQIWTPDVYQGAPSPISAFLAAGPKAAAFAVFVRVFLTAFGPIAARWEPIVWASALATMVVGNFAALTQTNVKRLLAYSSIAHAGYVMVAITAHSVVGTAAVMFYLAAYIAMNVGAFAVVTYFSRKGERYVSITDFAGLGVRQPVVAALFSVFLLSLIGVPLTAGFFGKFYVFRAALASDLVWLTVLGLLNSAVSVYYYLRLMVVMYMHEPAEATEDLPPVPFGLQATLWASAAATLALGIFPSPVLDYAVRAADFFL